MASAVQYLLKKIGVPICFEGYRYLTDAIELYLKDNTVINCMRQLYQDVSTRHSTSESVVESSISLSIIKTCERKNAFFKEVLCLAQIDHSPVISTEQFVKMLGTYLSEYETKVVDNPILILE